MRVVDKDLMAMKVNELKEELASQYVSPSDVMVFHNEITESVISRSGSDFMPRDLRLMI